MRKILVMILFLICLESCQTQPQEFTASQCQAIISIDSYGDVDERSSFCRCRNYIISRDFIGSRGSVTRKPLRECDQLIGYPVRENTRLVDFMEFVRSEINASQEIMGDANFREPNDKNQD